MEIVSKLSDVLGRYLDVTSSQLQLTAENMANVDTPGYRTQGLDFAAVFNNALRDSQLDPAAAAGQVAGLVSRPDGNNVSMDREGMNLAKEQLEFRTAVDLLKHEFQRTMNAIHADGK